MSNSTATATFSRPKILIICFIAWTLTNMDQAFFGYALPGILAEFNLPLQAAGTILTISFVLSAILMLFVGAAADRFGRGPLLCLLLGVSALLVGLQGLAGGIVLLTLFRAMGFGLSNGLSPITNAYVVENVQPRLRGMAMGVLQCGYPLGWFLASIIAAPLLVHYSWREICMAAFLVIPVAILFWWMLRDETGALEMPEDNPMAKGSIGELFSPKYRTYSIASIITYFAFGGAYAGTAFYFPSYFGEVRGYTPAEATTLVGYSYGIAIVGYLAAAYIGDFITSRRNVYVIWVLGGALALLGLMWIPDTRTEDLLMFALMTALFYGSIAVLPVLIAEIYEDKLRASGLAVCASAPLSLGFAVFPMIVPVFVTSMGWRMAFSVVVVPLLIIAAIAAMFLPNIKSGQELADTSVADA